jgi:glycosyltransferase involved in cell wall biosynthesis
MKKVSVVMPAYNQAEYIREAINSVLRQSYEYLELIIVDDGSTDETAEVVRSFGDRRIIFIQQENCGLSGARNRGIVAATGEYLAFLDSDDKYARQKLETQVRFLEEHKEVGIVAGGWRVIDADGRVRAYMRPWQNKEMQINDINTWLRSCPMTPHSLLLRKDWIEKVGGFDERFRRLEDWDLYLRLKDIGCVFGYLEDIVCDYRLHGENMTRNAVEQARTMIKVLDKYFSNENIANTILEKKDNYYAFAYIRGAVNEYVAGELTAAKIDLAKAVVLDEKLLKGEKDIVFNYLVAMATHPYVENPLQYIHVTFDNLPENAKELSMRKPEAIGKVAMAVFFQAYETDQYSEVLRYFPIGIKHDPKWLFNRGVWSIWMKSFIRQSSVLFENFPDYG